MAFEYQMLTVMTLFYLFAWFPSSIAKYQSFGAKWLGSNRTPLAGKELPPWGGRAERAYQNLKDFYPAFVVAILTLGALNRFDTLTSWSAGLYVFFRLTHMASYIAGNVTLRALSWTVAMLTNAILLIKVLL